MKTIKYIKMNRYARFTMPFYDLIYADRLSNLLVI